MRDYLMNCFYDGMTISETVNFIERCFSKKPSEKMISKIKSEIKNNTGKDWN